MSLPHSLLALCETIMLAGNSADRKELRGYVARAFGHHEMAEACRGFASGNPNEGLKPCLQSPFSADLMDIAATFRSLQQSRHDADYNILQKPKKTQMRSRLFEMLNGSFGSGEILEDLRRREFSYWRCL